MHKHNKSNESGAPLACRSGSVALRFLIAAAVSFGVLAQTAAAQAQAGAPLPMVDALRMSLQQHPELAAFAHRREAAEGVVTEAGFGERPEARIEIEDALGTGELRGFRSAQTTFGITWLLDGEVVESRVRAARSASFLVDVEREVKALDVTARTASLFIEDLAEQARVQLVEEGLQQATKALEAAQRRVNAGKASRVESLQAEAQLSQRELDLEDLSHRLKAGRYQLAAQWGGGAARVPVGDLHVLPAVPDFERQLQALRESPVLRAFATRQRIAESEIELARIEAKPRWQVSAGIRRSEALNDYALVAGVTIPFGQSERGSGRVQTLRAQQAEYEAEAKALESRLDSQLYVLLLEIEHGRHVVEALMGRILPALDKAQAEAARAYEQGQLGYLQWSSVRQDWLAARMALIDTLEEIHLQHIELQRLTGASLNP